MMSFIQKINQIVFISGVILLLSITGYAGDHEALIFDRITLTLYHLPKELSKSEAKCGYWASACPADASKNPDKKFIDEHSITKRPLFVEDTYKEGESISKVKQNICTKPFELSLVYNIKFLSFEFGYEVYYVADEFHKHETSNAADYKTVARATEVNRKMLGTGILLSLELFERIQSKLKEESETKWYDGKKMNLAWIPMFKVEYDFSHMILTKVTYDIRQNTRWPGTTECHPENYVLGNETYADFKKIGNIDVDKLYQNQANIFEDLKCPPGESCPMPVGESPSCDANTQCLKKWSLIPIDQFLLTPTSPLLCSNITTIPIWRTTAEGLLRKLDQFLYALSRHLGNPIHVIAGTIGNLKLPKNSKFAITGQPIYLDPKNNLMPVSDLIYKIVKYTLPNCKSKEETCEYSGIVFIHNDPNFDIKKDKMCKGTDDIGASGGWSAIMKNFEGKLYENIYVCQNTQELLNKMFGRFKIKPKPTSGNLYLNNFPYMDSNGSVAFDDIEGKVIEKFNELAMGKDALANDELIAVAQTDLNDIEGEPDFMAGGGTTKPEVK